MELVLQIASAVAFYFFTFIMFEKLYPRNNFKLWQKLLIVVFAAGIMIAVGYIRNPILNFSYSLLSMLLLNKILYRPDGKGFIIYDIVLLIIMMVIEMVSVSLLAVILNVNVGEITENPYLLSASAIMNWIVLFVALKIYMTLISSRQISNIKIQEFSFFIVLICCETFFLYCINDILMLSKMKYQLTIILLIFLLMDLYLEYLLHKISKSYKIEKKYDLVKQQSQLQLSAYRELSEKYNASRKIIHDVRKHISSLEGLINSNNAEIAEKYSSLLNKELDKLVPQFECDNPILTVIINNKLVVAEGMDIAFKPDIEFSELNFISELDITAIFSNILDNAFEACSELSKNKRYVNLSVARYNYFLLIYLENTYKEINLDENHKYKSTKPNHQGIGLSNVKKSVESYNGNLQTDTKNGLFISKILIPIPNNILFENS